MNGQPREILCCFAKGTGRLRDHPRRVSTSSSAGGMTAPPPPHHRPASRTALRDEARVSGNRQAAGGREVFRVAGRTPSRRRFLPRPLPTSVPQIRLWGGCRGVAIRFFVFCFCFPSFFLIFSFALSISVSHGI